MNSISSIIIKIRKQKGYSQEELASIAKVNLRTIQRIENNENEPRGKTLSLIAEALNLNIEDLTLLDCVNRKPNIGEKIMSIFFSMLINLALISIIGYLTLDSHANTNSRVAGLLLSFLIPFFVSWKTQNMSNVERVMKFGSGFIFYIIFSILIVGIPTSFVTCLIPNLLIGLATLFYGNEIIKLLN